MSHPILTTWMFSLLYLFLTNSAIAQIGQQHASEKIDEFMNSTTLIVLDEDAEYNHLISEIIDSFWTVTPYKYIIRADLTFYEGDPNYSMLVRNNAIRVVHRAGGRTSTIKMNDLGLFMCDQGALDNYLSRDALAVVHLKDVMNTADYRHKLTGLIQSMQAYVSFIHTEGINANKYERAIKNYQTEHVKSLMYRKLWICEDELPEKLRNPDKLKKAYKFDFEIVSKEKMEAALKNQDPEVAFFHMHPRQREYFIIDAKGGKLLYFSKIMDYGELKNKDFAALFRTIIAP